ncbi:demethoxyubiquinone hydroxylase family protein, partial [Klebsiella pneumoniae]|uniref:demethoxyubiquinone hydroxylase family protein n=2 Tax=Gammaproteobacteria TaxID=1236 RepID=UPI00200DF415
ALRANPAQTHETPPLDNKQQQLIAGLMRVNHTGEVCAQALYHGQALTAKLPTVREEMQRAALEEQDHLAWCEDRLKELNSHISVLNPLWYGLS